MHNTISTTSKKLNLLQMYRGLAALLVLLVHVNPISQEKFHKDFLLNFFYFGASGVDFFFVLSGFIIMHVHYGDINKKYKFLPFILKRFVRIYPTYWVVLLAVLPVFFLVPSWGRGYERNLSVIIKSLILWPQENTSIIIAAWTLSHEVLFYFMFGILILFKPKTSKFIVASWILSTCILFIIKIVSGEKSQYPFTIDFLFSSHNLEFVSGCLTAYITRVFKTKIKLKYALSVLVLGVFLFTCSALLQLPLTHGHPIRVIGYGASSMFIILGAALIDTSKQVFVPPVFYFFGDASYSIYLTHGFFLSAMAKIALGVSLERFVGHSLTMTLIIVIVVGCGCIVHQYIEKPLLTLIRYKIYKKSKY